MKKITSVLIATLILMTSLCIAASAGNANTYYYEIDDTEYTVEFTQNDLTQEKEQQIAETLINGESGVSTYFIGCHMFGHELSTTEVSVITHKVRTSIPRCKVEKYDVTTCENCDYLEEVLKLTSYTNCCPED